jgi:hypothetical protein
MDISKSFLKNFFTSIVFISTFGLGQGLVITEIMQNPSSVSDSDGEWFEIFNSGDIELDLNGWTIKDADTDNHTISSSLIINPGEYKVLGVNSNSSSNGGVTVDYQYSGITLANGADELVLINTNDTVFDSVAYDGGPDNDGGIFPDPTGASMALVHPDSNNNVGTNWQESTTSYGDGDLGTPGIPNFSSDISIDLTPLDFDTVFVNESGTLDLTISNNGNALLQIDSLYTSSDLFTLSINDSLIETSAILSITYTPVEFGPDTGTVYIKSNDPDEGLVQISLYGFGYYTSPDIDLSANSINFGGVMDGLTGIQLLHVYNTGDAALELDTMYCTGNFAVTPSNGTVDMGDTLALEVTFSPDDEASFEGMLTIVAGNDPDEDTLYVGLIGEGIPPAPEITLSTESIQFGYNHTIGDTLLRQLIVYNTGLLSLDIEEININTVDGEFWTDFSDGSIAGGDSLAINFFYLDNDIYVDIATAEIVNNDINVVIELMAGALAYIESDTVEIGSDFSISLILNNDITVSVVELYLYFDPNLLSISNYNPVGRWSEATIDNDSMIDNESGTLYIVSYNFATGIQAGTGPIFTFDMHNFATDIAQTELISVMGFRDIGVNPINGPTYGGIITFINSPPEPPSGLSVDLQENILITWNENNEEDLSHYVLDKSNDELFETGQYSSITTTEISYLDTVYEDGQVLYYRLSAVDSAENTSDFSDVISIDLSPPSPPTGLSVEFDGGILLSWDANPESDFLHYILDKAADSLFQTDQYSSITTTETSYLDTVYEDGATIYYRLSAVDTDGFVSEFTELVFIHVVLGIDDKLIPEVFALHQNYPNPFNPTTQIKYDLPENTLVKITIYDLMGRSIKSLVNSNQSAGYRSIQWNATNNLGEPVSAGMYIYMIQAGKFRQTKKMVLLK